MSGTPGSAVLDPDVLLDSLVSDVIDELRADLYPTFGVRGYIASIVTRRWSGRVVGEGKFVDTVVEMVTRPLVEVWSGLTYELLACGLSSSGDIRLTEVSLTYTYAELVGDQAHANAQTMIMLSEGHGQGQPATYWVHSKPPYVDREKTLGWILWLKAFDTAGAP